MSERKDFRTPLARVSGLGAARTGTGHFWWQRLTAVANVPLTIAFIIILVSLLGRNQAAAQQILGTPFVAVTMLLFIASFRLLDGIRDTAPYLFAAFFLVYGIAWVAPLILRQGK